MKSLLVFLCMLIAGHKFNKEVNYTASTPAGRTVRDFLGISQADSIDFIRWYLKIADQKEFDLSCSYGIGKPNTNGFIDEKKVSLKGTANFNNGILTLNHLHKLLSMQVLNHNIMHLLNKDGSMMVGNGGWSYTLNAINPLPASEIKLATKNTGFTDSIIFEGRTPCRGMEELMIGKTRPECYKKKWLLSLYKSGSNATSGRYKIGSAAEPKTGNWKLKKNDDGKIIYSLDLNNGNTLDLLHADKNILYIMDVKGGLMVGDHDFSYSLNRRIK
jgi:hypothetical protein